MLNDFEGIRLSGRAEYRIKRCRNTTLFLFNSIITFVIVIWTLKLSANLTTYESKKITYHLQIISMTHISAKFRYLQIAYQQLHEHTQPSCSTTNSIIIR